MILYKVDFKYLMVRSVYSILSEKNGFLSNSYTYKIFYQSPLLFLHVNSFQKHDQTKKQKQIQKLLLHDFLLCPFKGTHSLVHPFKMLRQDLNLWQCSWHNKSGYMIQFSEHKTCYSSLTSGFGGRTSGKMKNLLMYISCFYHTLWYAGKEEI